MSSGVRVGGEAAVTGLLQLARTVRVPGRQLVRQQQVDGCFHRPCLNAGGRCAEDARCVLAFHGAQCPGNVVQVDSFMMTFVMVD